MATEFKRMLQLGDTELNWTAAGFVPVYREWCVELLPDGTFRGKVGNGVDDYPTLPYFTGYTEAEVQAIVNAYVATLGIQTSTGAPDDGKLVRLNASGLVDNSMLPASAFFGWIRDLGGINAIDNGPTGSEVAGDMYQHTIGSGKYHVDWDLTRGAVPAGDGVDTSPYDKLVYSGQEWLLWDGNPRASTPP